jgi:NTE family protein
MDPGTDRPDDGLTPPRQLVFAGCGVCNVAYAGGLLALEDTGLSAGIRAVAGTSSGSIIATLFSLGLGAGRIRQAMYDLDFARIPDGGLLPGALRLLLQCGWHRGDYFVGELGKIVKAELGSARATFRELYDRRPTRLRIIATNVSRSEVRVFPDERSWDMPLTEAVRISMSIPLVFAARRLDDEVYADGGVLWNYPISIFDAEDDGGRATLGFHVHSTAVRPRRAIASLHQYAGPFFETLLRQQSEQHRRHPADVSRSIAIDDLGIAGTNFGISIDQKKRLMDHGEAVTRERLESWGHRA